MVTGTLWLRPVAESLMVMAPEQALSDKPAGLTSTATTPEVELVALATTRLESADKAAARFGARLAFDDPYALIDSD